MHPETRRGEVFLSNIDSGTFHTTFRTLRIGRVAYDCNGCPVKGLLPAFVTQDEIKKTLGEKKLREFINRDAACIYP